MSYQIACVYQWVTCRPIKQTVPGVSVVSHTEEHDLQLCPRPWAWVSSFWITKICSKLLQASFPDLFTRVTYRTFERKPLELWCVILYVLECCWYENPFPSAKEWDNHLELPSCHSCSFSLRGRFKHQLPIPVNTGWTEKCQMPLARAHLEGLIAHPNVTVVLGESSFLCCYLCISVARKLSWTATSCSSCFWYPPVKGHLQPYAYARAVCLGLLFLLCFMNSPI